MIHGLVNLGSEEKRWRADREPSLGRLVVTTGLLELQRNADRSCVVAEAVDAAIHRR